MKKIFDILTQRPLVFLIGSLILALPLISLLPFVKLIDNIDYFTLEHDPDAEFYVEFKEIFGNDEFFVIAFEKENIFTRRNLIILKNITEELAALEEVREVKSLANVDDAIGSWDYFEVRKLAVEFVASYSIRYFILFY